MNDIVQWTEAAVAVARRKGCRCADPRVELTVTIFTVVGVRVDHPGGCVRGQCAPTVNEVEAEVRCQRRTRSRQEASR